MNHFWSRLETGAYFGSEVQEVKVKLGSFSCSFFPWWGQDDGCSSSHHMSLPGKKESGQNKGDETANSGLGQIILVEATAVIST